MKKNILILTAAVIFALSGCGDTAKGKAAVSVKNCDYDIEAAFPDERLADILSGEIVPTEMVYTMCGECLVTYNVKDEEMIKKFVEAFRELKIENVITDKDEMRFVSDGGNDFCFITKDGSEVRVSLDLCSYVNVGDVQYEFENNEMLCEALSEVRSNREYGPH